VIVSTHVMTNLSQMNKKGTEMFWVIIGAVLALTVLIFSIYTLTSQGSKASKVLDTCSGKGGECFDSPCGRGDASDSPTVLGIGCEKDGEHKAIAYCCSG